MIKSELVQKISEENPHLFQRDVERLVNTIFNEITDAMSSGRRIELRGFGAFSVKHRKPRLGRNPRTGRSVEVEEKIVPFFKPGKLMRDKLLLKLPITKDLITSKNNAKNYNGFKMFNNLRTET